MNEKKGQKVKNQKGNSNSQKKQIKKPNTFKKSLHNIPEVKSSGKPSAKNSIEDPKKPKLTESEIAERMKEIKNRQKQLEKVKKQKNAK